MSDVVKLTPKKTNNEKKREERWSQPFSNAKIEDLHALANILHDSIEKINQTAVSVGYSYDVLVETLINKGIITKEELNKTASSFQKKQEKFMELMKDEELTPEEKTAIAAEYEIDFDFTKVGGVGN